MPGQNRGRLDAETVKARLQQLDVGRTEMGGDGGEPWCWGGRSQWGPGEPAPVQATPRPRPRPLLSSPPLPQGWGRPLPGPKGRPGFRAEGLTSTKRCQERKARFIGSLGGREESVGSELGGEEGSPGGSGPAVVGGRRQVPGDFCGVKKVRGRRASPSHHAPALRPLLFSPSSLSLVKAAGSGWVPSRQVFLPPAAGQT